MALDISTLAHAQRIEAAQTSPHREWCVANGHPAATFNPWLDVTFCLCGEYVMRGDHGAVTSGHVVLRKTSNAWWRHVDAIRVARTYGVHAAAAAALTAWRGSVCRWHRDELRCMAAAVAAPDVDSALDAWSDGIGDWRGQSETYIAQWRSAMSAARTLAAQV